MTDEHILQVKNNGLVEESYIASLLWIFLFFPEIQCRITATPLHLGDCIVMSDSILGNRQLVRQLRELKTIGDGLDSYLQLSKLILEPTSPTMQ